MLQVQEFLQHGANPDSSNTHGMTCLHWASQNEDILVMDVLLQNGANPDAQAQDGCTPLHLACREENGAAVALLLRCFSHLRLAQLVFACEVEWAALVAAVWRVHFGVREG